jgi:hypothetical protein
MGSGFLCSVLLRVAGLLCVYFSGFLFCFAKCVGAGIYFVVGLAENV